MHNEASAHRSRAADPLKYAFSSDGWLDPGTKLLDIGLNDVTPIGALRDLEAHPLHLSVALHEITHFVSLESTLGHLIALLALRAQTIGEALMDHARQRTRMEPSWIPLYEDWYRPYLQLVELWRPLLEGLAVYAQTHWPNSSRDELIDPLSLLWHWKLSTVALGGEQDTKGAPSSNSIDGGFLQHAYQAIAQGPELQLGQHSLAASLELINPASMKPYFLGHAYLRALQRELSVSCADYQIDELFFQLVMRILRTSTRSFLATVDAWDQPIAAHLIYGWIDIVRQAPAARIVQLRTQPDQVDVLNFLATGEEREGYRSTDTDQVATLAGLIPGLWRQFEAEASQNFAPLAAAGGSDGQAKRLTRAWLRGTMALNLSSHGTVRVAGWIPQGLSPFHALALKVDEALWWLAANDNDIALLAGEPHGLPRLPVQALLYPHVARASGRVIAINCFTKYVRRPQHLAQYFDASLMLPELGFELMPTIGKSPPLLAEIVPGKLGVHRPYLRVVHDPDRVTLHRSTMEIREMVRKSVSPASLATELTKQGDPATAEAVRKLDESTGLSTMRIQAQVERRILLSLLKHQPSSATLVLVKRGIGCIEGAAALEPLITAAYARPVTVETAVAEAACRFNERAHIALGLMPFKVDQRKTSVRYRGLWGDT